MSIMVLVSFYFHDSIKVVRDLFCWIYGSNFLLRLRRHCFFLAWQEVYVELYIFMLHGMNQDLNELFVYKLEEG